MEESIDISYVQPEPVIEQTEPHVIKACDGIVLMGELIGWDRVAELKAARLEAGRQAARLRHGLGMVSVLLSSKSTQ